MSTEKGVWADLLVPGAELRCHVTPRAGRDDAARWDGVLHIRVTDPPEDGKANKAVRKILARALGIAPGRLVLVRGDKSREKVFRIVED